MLDIKEIALIILNLVDGKKDLARLEGLHRASRILDIVTKEVEYQALKTLLHANLTQDCFEVLF